MESHILIISDFSEPEQKPGWKRICLCLDATGHLLIFSLPTTKATSILAASRSRIMWFKCLPVCLCLRLGLPCYRWMHRTFQNIQRRQMLSKSNTLIVGCHCLMWYNIYNSARPHFTFFHLLLWIYVGHSFWSLAFFLSKNRFQVGSMHRSRTSVCSKPFEWLSSWALERKQKSSR